MSRKPRPEVPRRPPGIVAWWKHPDLLLSSEQLRRVGLGSGQRQLRLWIEGYIR